MSSINLIVASSNVFGALAAYKVRHNPTASAIIGAAALASTLMHLSNREHGLPGIRPFKRWPGAFHWVDSVASMTASAYGIYSAFRKDNLITGILCALITIIKPKTSGHGRLAIVDRGGSDPAFLGISILQWVSATAHCIWHCEIYSVLALACA